MEENRITLSARAAPPVEEITERLKEKLSGMNNPGELLSKVHRKIGEHKLVVLTFLKPHPLTRGHSVLTILLAEEGDLTNADLICVNTTAYFYGASGNQRYRKEAERVLRELGFTGEHDAEQTEEKGLLSALKRFWNTDET